jgi:integrase
MPRPRPPFLHREESRHGRVAWYVRRGGGRRIRLNAQYGSEAFWAEYRAALEAGSPATGTAKPHTLAWALERYRNSSAWAALSNATRRQRENIFRQVVEQKQPSGGLAGDLLVRQITAETIRAARERRASKPHATNNFIKSMRAFFAWAIENKVVAVDPTRGIKLLHGPNDEIGHHTWTQDELDRFEARWPVGTRERLAYDLLLYTGLRRGDAVRLGRQHMQDGLITIRTEKHRKGKSGELISIPILPPLAVSIAATITGDMTYLVD